MQIALKKLRGINRLFLITVAAPTLVSGIYLGLVASDVYISESRFVVRSPQPQNSGSGLGALLQGAGFSKAQDDTYAVHEYMKSRDVLQKLEVQLKISKSFSSDSIDLFSKFGGLGFAKSFEDFHQYFQKHLQIDFDTASSISTVKIRAYTAEDAYKINEKLIELSEALVNQLNERGRKDMIRFAQEEVAIAEKNAKQAALALSGFRNKKNVFDPEKQSALQLQQISKLQDELIATKLQLIQIKTVTPMNPQIANLEKRVVALEADIKTETTKVVGSGTSLSTKASEYERLSLDRAFSDKQLATALASLEQARNDAQRKQLYLERIAQPSKPDTAMEPRRLRSFLAIVVLGLITWGILTMLFAGIKEHQD